MPLTGKEVIDLEYPTGFATSPNQAGVTGGAAVGKPFTPNPFLPPDRYGVLDITVSAATGQFAPAAKGALLVLQTEVNPFTNGPLGPTGVQGMSLAANNTTAGGGFWAQAGNLVQNSTGNGTTIGAASQPLTQEQRGIVETVVMPAFPNTAPLQYGRCTIVVRGPVQALCVAPQTSNAINVGTLLTSDGNGNLQPLLLPSAAPTILTGTTQGLSTTSACPAYALVAISKDGTYSAIGANFGVSVPLSLGAAQVGTGATTINSVLLTWTPSADHAGYIVMRTGSVGMSQVNNPNLLGAIGFVPGGQDYFVDYGQIPLSGTSATQPFARPPVAGTPTITQVTAAVSGPASVAYKISAIAPNGVWGTESANGSTTTGNAILTPSGGNVIKWTNTTGIALYAVDRTVALSVTNLGATSLGFIGFASSTAAINGFVDYGQQAVTFSSAVVTTPPPTPLDGVAIATAMGSLAAATSVATLVPVYLGNLC